MNLSTGNGIRIGRGLAAIVAALAFALVALAQAVTTTTVQGTVYFANGQPGSGTVQIQWPSFTTAGGQAIAAGSTTVTVGSDGFLSVNLAPNQDATPAGLFYTVTYYLSNGVTNTEYWVVPDAAQATLAQVRSTVMPSSQAIQTVSKAYVDQAIANLSQGGLAPTGGTLSGPLYLAGDPTSSLQAADKHYVDTSLAQTFPLSGGTLSGPLNGPSVNASVNNVINVMAPPYNAKGDCSTDDHNAIQAALNAAQSDTSSNTVVYFPTPPGGCYLTSQLNWYGVSLQGEAGNNQNGQTWQGVTLKGEPGQDILHTGDPNSTSTVPTRLWSLENIRFLLDDSLDASSSSGNFAHRWPGKWVGDGAMTSGSATLTSTYAEFTCGDIGQSVLVKGAGAGGADLSTTISSVSPCYTSVAPTTATLAAAASTTVSAARVYIAVAGMPVTQQIGNCAIAMDNSDGNSGNWLGSATRLPLYDNLHNVNFSTTSNTLQGQNNSCAVYFQGAYMPYGLDARNVNITRFTYGVVEGLSDVNPVGASGNNVGVGEDYQLWDHGDWVSKYPWISYNGSNSEMKGIQLYATAGPQLLQVKSPSENAGTRWKIEAPEFEQPAGALSGWRIDLDLNTLINTQLASVAANIPAFIEGYGNRCIDCTGAQTLNVGGYGNNLQLTYGPATVNDSGYGNTVSTVSNSAAYAGQTPTRPVAQNATRGTEPWGRLSADFIRTGNVNTPYMNLEDLLIQPADVRWLSGYGTVVYPDATSITGKYGYTNGVYTVMGFANPVASALTGNTYNYVIGGVGAGKANVPATRITLYASVKCPSVTNYTLTVREGSTTVATATPTCNSSGYTVGSVTADLSSYAGQNFGFAIGSGSGEVDWSYVAVRPFQADYNGYQPIGSFTYAGTGTPTATCSATSNNGWFAINATPAAYQCSSATGSYAWNTFGGSGGSVASIDSQTGAFTFTGPGVSHTGDTYTFSGTGSGVASLSGASGANVTLTGASGSGSNLWINPNPGAPFCTVVAQSGYKTTKKCENFVYTLDLTPGAGGFTFNNEFSGTFGPCDTKYAVDSVNGSDSNVGTCAAPFQTLTKMRSVTLVAGDSIGFAAGSHWRDFYQPGQSVSNLKLAAYGQGTRPEIDGYTVIPNANFTLASGETYTYQATVSIQNASGAGPFINLDENGTYFPNGGQSSVANVDATAGSYYYSQSACTSSSTCTLYIHPLNNTDPSTDGNTYEYTDALNTNILYLLNNPNSEISGLWVRGGHTIMGTGEFIHDFLMTESLYHSMYVNENNHLQNVVADGGYDSKYQTNMGGPLPFINYFAPSGGYLQYDGVVANFPATPVANQSASCESYYGHTPGGGTQLSSAVMNGFIANNCSGPEFTLGTTDYVNGVYLMGNRTNVFGAAFYDPNAYINGVISNDDENTSGSSGVISLRGTGNYQVTNSSLYLAVPSGTGSDSLVFVSNPITSLVETNNAIDSSASELASVNTGAAGVLDNSTSNTIGTLAFTDNSVNTPTVPVQLAVTPTTTSIDYTTHGFNVGTGGKIGNTNYSPAAWRGLGYDVDSIPYLSFNANWGSTASIYGTPKIPTEYSGSKQIWAQGTGQASGATLTYTFPTPFNVVPLVTVTYSSISSCGSMTYAAPTVTTSSVTFTTTAAPAAGAICQIAWVVTP